MDYHSVLGARPVNAGSKADEMFDGMAKERPAFSLDDAMSVLRKRILLILVSTVVAISFAVFTLSSAVPRYMASAELLLGSQIPVDLSSSDLLESRALSDTAIQGELAILTSSALLVRVAQRLELDKDPEFNDALRPPEDRIEVIDNAKALVKRLLFPPKPVPDAGQAVKNDAMQEASLAKSNSLGELGGPVGVLRNNISVYQRGRSFVVAVTLNSEDPVKAAGIANTVVDEYIDFVSDKRFEAAQRFTSWLEMRVEELARAVEESETAVIAFQVNDENRSDNAARVEQQMQEMTTKLVDTRTELAETEAMIAKAEELLARGDAFSAAGLLNSPVLESFAQQIAELRRAEAMAIQRFSPESSQVDAIQREQLGMRDEVETEVRQAITELVNRAEVLRINVAALRGGLNDLENLVRMRSKEAIQLNQLERMADANRRLYEDFLDRYKESREIQNLRLADAEVISYATPPSSPATPRKKPTLVLATAAGMFVGIGIAFLLELLPKRFSSSTEVTNRAGLKVFGQMPKVPSRAKAGAVARRLRANPHGNLTRATEDLAQNVELGLGHDVGSVMVVSNHAGGEKTTIAMLLGWEAAKRGRSCLVIDADIRNAALTRRFVADVDTGLLDVLYGRTALDDAILHHGALGVSVLPAQTSNVDPVTLFGTTRANDLFRELTDRYDTIVIDAPPLDSVSDIVTLSDGVDAGIFVISAGKTRIKSVQERLRLFRSVKMQIAGAVITRAKYKARTERLHRSSKKAKTGDSLTGEGDLPHFLLQPSK